MDIYIEKEKMWYMCVCIYIYIEREREREREKERERENGILLGHKKEEIMPATSNEHGLTWRVLC